MLTQLLLGRNQLEGTIPTQACDVSDVSECVRDVSGT
jgi:hypothetical protein